MKKSFILIPVLAIWAISCSKEQTQELPEVNCTISNEADSFYVHDAAQLAVQYLYSIGSPDTAQVIIPAGILQPFTRILGAIYDADIPQRDTVVNKNLHCEINSTYDMVMQVEAGTMWVDNWVNGVIPTGETIVDNAIADYNLSITPLANAGIQPWYSIQNGEIINALALARIFRPLPGVDWAEPNSYWSTHSKINCHFSGSIAHVVFYEGWGDCPAGCFGYHRWEFDVDTENCSVTFTGYYE